MHIVYKILIVFFFMNCLNIKTIAQTNYLHYTLKDGLVQMQCMTMFQDSKGYLWIGTKGGVSKFDGINFKNFTIDNGLADNYITKFQEDSNGSIWALSKTAVNLVKEDTVYNYKYSEQGYFREYQMYLVNSDTLLLNYSLKNNNKIVKFINGAFFDFKDIISTKLTKIYYSKKDKNTYLYYNDSLFILVDSTLNFTDNLKFESEQHYFTENDNNLYFNCYNLSSNKKHKLFKIESGKITEIKSFPEKINLYTIKNDSDYVYSKPQYATRFTSKIYHQKKDTCYGINVNLYSIRDAFIDNENNIWLLSENGLSKTTKISNYTKESGVPKYVWSIVEDSENKLWFASFGSKYLYYYQNDSFIKYNQAFGSDNFYFGAIKLSDGSVEFPLSGYIIRYRNKKFTSDYLKAVTTLSILEDINTKAVYYGTTFGLIQKFKDNYKIIDSSFIKGVKEYILCMRQNKKGEIWYCTGSYIGTLNKNEIIEINLDSLPIYRSVVLYFDYKDNLWIGADNGLYLYNYKNFIKIKHPELNTIINSICQTDSTHFVYGGKRGIGIFDLEAFYDYIDENLQGFQNLEGSNKPEINAEPFVNYYDQSSGFMGEEVGQNGIFKDSQGRVWVPTNTNVVMFRPEDLKRNTKAPQTHITDFSASTDNINWTKQADSIHKLTYEQNNIRFDYIGISLSAPHLVKYKYRLLGFNDNWSNETKERYVNFTNLKPKKYRFELMACNSNGVWNDEAVYYEFQIVPAWWQTAVFKIGIWILSLLLTISIIGIILHTRFRRKQEKQKMIDLQYKAARSQLYPHFLFNAVSAIGSFIYNNDPDKAYNYFVKLSKLIREVLQDSKQGYKTLKQEIEFVRNYLELQKLRFEKRFDYQIKIDKSINCNIEIPQMMIQTYVENAIKHGLEPLKEGGKLIIDISEQNRHIVFVIEDNGIGIEAAKRRKAKGTGTGLKVMNDIYKLHNNHFNTNIEYQLIDLYTQNKKGTRVEVRVKS